MEMMMLVSQELEAPATIEPARLQGLALSGSAPDIVRYDPLLHVVAMLKDRWQRLTKHDGYVADTARRSLWYLDVIEARLRRG